MYLSVHREKKENKYPIRQSLKFSSFVLFLYFTACQHPAQNASTHAWPASTYGHLRGVSLTFQLFTFERISWFGGKGIGKYPLRYFVMNNNWNVWKIKKININTPLFVQWEYNTYSFLSAEVNADLCVHYTCCVAFVLSLCLYFCLCFS